MRRQDSLSHHYLRSALTIFTLCTILLVGGGVASTTGKYCVHEGMCVDEDKGSYALLKHYVCVGNECGVEWSGPRFVAILLLTTVFSCTVGCCWKHWSARRRAQ